MRLGVRSSEVCEVLRAAALSPLPQAPPTVEGVLNLRGWMTPVLDARAVLGIDSRPMHYNDHLLVLSVQQRRIALHVDRAIGLWELERAAESAQASPWIEFAAQLDQSVVHVIRTERWLACGDEQQDVRRLEAVNTEKTG